MADIDSKILKWLDDRGTIEDTDEALEQALAVEHDDLVVTINSLGALEMIVAKPIKHERQTLAEEAESYVGAGSPEAQVFAAVPSEGISISDLKKVIGAAAENGQRQAMQRKWIRIDKETKLIHRQVDAIEDSTQQQLQAVKDGRAVAEADIKALSKRKLLIPKKWTSFQLSKGPNFALQRQELTTDLTTEMLASGKWKDAKFKNYKFEATCPAPAGGFLHPLLKVRSQFRKIFMQMGFAEMPTNAYVENSFWNFDSLFQPQQHPARDAHDTFFLKSPAATPLDRQPQDYVETTRRTHERGIDGSRGYESYWKTVEAEKNLLRTHTTAVSARMLYRLARDQKKGFQPVKYFSIDRVFRNEAIDRTHLAEFHQVEGLVCDRGLTLGHLIGLLREFFKRLGMPQLRFKPAYNPYTEPSMEIFGYSKELDSWMELGNSGMFRPEMLLPMGLPPDVTVIAWGLSLERPTMILNKLDNIRDLFGHKVSLSAVSSNPICRLGFQCT